MKTAIALSPDPVYLTPFVRRLVERYPESIDLVLCAGGDITRRRTLARRFEYFLALVLILGPWTALRNALTLVFRRTASVRDLERQCVRHGIPLVAVRNVNDDEAIEAVTGRGIDLLLNQSHFILRQGILKAPKIAVFNRHGAMLPKYRGRLAPFWQLLHRERAGGISYHVVDEEIDNGPIIVQVPIPVDAGETVSSLIGKMFDRAVDSFGDVLSFFGDSDYPDRFIPNPKSESTYYSSPRLRDALRFRLGR